MFLIRTELRSYQKEAVEKAVSVIQHGGGFGLWPEPRCGKTLIALSIVDRVRPDALLIVCPKNAIRVWQEELRKHLNRPYGIPTQVVNYELLTNNRKQFYQQCRAHSRLMIICDEAHFIKRRGTARSRVVRHIGGFARYRLALTGTPIAQGVQDAWAVYDFLDSRIFGTWDEFSNTYLVWGGFKKHQIIKYRNEEEFNSKFHINSFRVTLREVRKQPLLINYRREYVDLGSYARRVYEQLKEELQAEVDAKKVKVKNVLVCVMKLQQIVGGYLLIPELNGPIGCQWLGQEKLEKLHEVTRSLTARKKFIVIARFLHEIEAIASFLRRLGYNVQTVQGGKPYDGKFDCDCIVMQIQSGIAVDMAHADTIIFYSIDYSYINYEQARFRILSYDKPFARYVFLLARDTVDEQIYLAVTTKQKVSRIICDFYRTVNQLSDLTKKQLTARSRI